MAQSGDNGGVPITPWDPSRVLRKVDASEVKYSRGFLRCRPERWFPGFAAQWLPLAHSLGSELKVVEVKPSLVTPRNLSVGFTGTVDDEPLAIFYDDASLDVILDTIAPGIAPHAMNLVAEYVSRRVLGSLALAWSGPETSVTRFTIDKPAHEVSCTGAVKFTVDINGATATLWIVMGRALVEKLDGLWRRQVRAASRAGEEGAEVRLELVHLGVPPALLVDYVKSGAIVDLETLATDQIVLRTGGKGWLPGKLISVGGNLGFEVVAGAVPHQALPEGTTRLSIELGTVRYDSSTLAEMAQVGAQWDTGVSISNRVVLSINGEKVGEATLGLFEGRFAITVD